MNGTAFFAEHETAIRLGAFVSVFAIMAAWEVLAPRRPLSVPKAQRWAANISIVVFNSIFIRFLFPVATVGAAAISSQQGWGVFNLLDVPPWLAIPLSIIALDAVIYFQHVMFHAVPALWRLHRVHHADLDFDVTTGARFHPFEIALSMLIKFAAIILLGAPVAAVVLFEVLLNALAMFNHANVRLPPAVDRSLRCLIVTPDMHRIHHSIEPRETDGNFGFNLSLWDRLLGTYRADPAAGHEAMGLGIPDFRSQAQCATFSGMLALPFRRAKDRVDNTGPVPSHDMHDTAENRNYPRLTRSRGHGQDPVRS